MDECAAALVLMSLSGSPKSPHWGENGKMILYYCILFVASWHLKPVGDILIMEPAFHMQGKGEIE